MYPTCPEYARCEGTGKGGSDADRRTRAMEARYRPTRDVRFLDEERSARGVEGIKMKRNGTIRTDMHVRRTSGVPKVVSGGAARYVLKCHFVSLVQMALVWWKLRKILSDIEDKCTNNLFR